MSKFFGLSLFSKKGQIGTEYLLIVSFALFVLIPVALMLFTNSQTTSDQAAILQAQQSAKRVVDTVSTVYSLGPPTSMQVSIIVPPKVNSSVVGSREVGWTILTSNGPVDVIEISPVDIVGALPLIAGTHLINITAQNNSVSITQPGVPTPTPTPTPSASPTPTPTPPPNTCSALCVILGGPSGTCRKASNYCSKNGETWTPAGDPLCIIQYGNDPNQDTCCCQPGATATPTPTPTPTPTATPTVQVDCDPYCKGLGYKHGDCKNSCDGNKWIYEPGGYCNNQNQVCCCENP